MNAAIHVALGSKVEYCPRLVLQEQAADQVEVADITLDEDMPGVAAQGREVLEVARVGKRVEIDHRLVRPGKPVEYEIAADEAGTAGDQYRHAEATCRWAHLAPGAGLSVKPRRAVRLPRTRKPRWRSRLSRLR